MRITKLDGLHGSLLMSSGGHCRGNVTSLNNSSVFWNDGFILPVTVTVFAILVRSTEMSMKHDFLPLSFFVKPVILKNFLYCQSWSLCHLDHVFWNKMACLNIICLAQFFRFRSDSFDLLIHFCNSDTWSLWSPFWSWVRISSSAHAIVGTQSSPCSDPSSILAVHWRPDYHYLWHLI